MRWEVVAFGVNNWRIVSSTGKYSGMTGSGTTKTRVASKFLALPHRILTGKARLPCPLGIETRTEMVGDDADLKGWQSPHWACCRLSLLFTLMTGGSPKRTFKIRLCNSSVADKLGRGLPSSVSVHFA